MSYKVDKVKGEGLHIKYSEAFKRAVVAEYEQGLLNKDQIQARHGIGGNSRILEWCRKYGKLDYPKPGALGRPLKDPQKQRIRESEQQLAEAKLKSIAYEKLIEIAEQEEGISILKKRRCQAIRELAKMYPQKVSMFCDLFGYSRRTYYKGQHQHYSTVNEQQGQYIEIHPEVMTGNPVIKGTRITVELILEKLSEGETIQDILIAYPQITQEATYAALAYAASKM